MGQAVHLHFVTRKNKWGLAAHAIINAAARWQWQLFVARMLVSHDSDTTLGLESQDIKV